MIDHVVLAVPDLADGVARFHRMTGVRPVPGGSHVGLGTSNCLVGLGGGAYLEIIGPDAGQPEPAGPRPFGLDGLTAATVVGWCVRPRDLDRAVAQARGRGYDPGVPSVISRRTSDGTLVTCRITRIPTGADEGIVPFLIDWGSTPHPTTAPLPTVPLRSIGAEHPEPDRMATKLAALDVDLPIRSGPRPGLVVTLQGPDGEVALS